MYILIHGITTERAIIFICKAESYPGQYVLEMFLKRLRHHASQLHMFLEKIKIGKVGLSTLMFGNYTIF